MYNSYIVFIVIEKLIYVFTKLRNKFNWRRIVINKWINFNPIIEFIVIITPFNTSKKKKSKVKIIVKYSNKEVNTYVTLIIDQKGSDIVLKVPLKVNS